jgi:hypothetical protein
MSARLTFKPLRAYTTQNDRDQLARFNFHRTGVIYGHDHLKHCSNLLDLIETLSLSGRDIFRNRWDRLAEEPASSLETLSRSGTIVTLTASPTNDSSFTGWIAHGC